MKTSLIIIVFTFLFPFALKAKGFDHNYRLYQTVLKESVVARGPQSLVNYKALKASPQKLDRVLVELSSVTQKDFKSWKTQERLAFLINAYNAFTLKLIINHYPVESIKDIGSFFSSPWKKKFFTFLGEKTHLDHIEHTLIRKNFKEPRIHFAVNCASLGCPSLALEPFIASKIEDQLKEASKVFLTNSERNRFDPKSETLYLSKIFKWYGDDFKKMTNRDFKDFVKDYFPKFNPQKHDLEWLDYDWKLNQVP